MNTLGDQIKTLVQNLIYIEPCSFNRVKPGDLNLKGGQIFVTQFSHFTRNFPRWLAAVSANCPLPDVRQFIAGNLSEEEGGAPGHRSHYELLVTQGEALGLSREEIEHTIPLPTTALAVNALNGICRNREWLEALAATTGLECINHPQVRSVAGALIINNVRAWEHLDLNAQQLESRTIHMENDERHVEAGLAILAAHSTSKEANDRILCAAHEAVFAFRVLMDGIGRAALTLHNV